MCCLPFEGSYVVCFMVHWKGCGGMVWLAVVVFAVCSWLCCMVLEYLVSNGADCSRVVVLEGVVDVSILVLAVKVIF